jgi:hypothetical protein
MARGGETPLCRACPGHTRLSFRPSTSKSGWPGQARPRLPKVRLQHALSSESFEILDQVILLRGAEVELEMVVVVVDHIAQGGEPPIMIKAGLLVRP